MWQPCLKGAWHPLQPAWPVQASFSMPVSARPAVHTHCNLQDQLITSEEQRLEVSQVLLDFQLEHNHAKVGRAAIRWCQLQAGGRMVRLSFICIV